MIKVSISGAAHQTTQFAADELTQYLTQMGIPAICTPVSADTDIRLQVVADDQTHDHIIIDQHAGHCMITGNSQLALLIGVYQYLQHLGVRFLRPGEDGDLIPNCQEDFISADYLDDHVASQAIRGTCIEGADSLENVLDFIDWLPKLGFNTFFVQFRTPDTFLRRWYQHLNNPMLAAEAVTDDDYQAMSAKIDAAMRQRSLHHHRVGHGWINQALGFTEAAGWDPVDVPLSATLKPLVAEINGQREFFKKTPLLTNLDFANPKAMAAFNDQVYTYAQAHPEVDYLHVWLSDGTNNVCECADCQQTTLSDQYVTMLNQLDERLTAAGIKTKIVFLLYNELLMPPRQARFTHPERFVMMFAPILRQFERSYADVERPLPSLPPYHRNQFATPQHLADNMAYLAAWQECFDGETFVYDYPLGRAHYGDFGYVKIAQTIYQDIHQLNQLQLDGYVSCQELRIGFPNTLPNYVMGQALWDESLSFETIKQAYFTAAYGDQAAAVDRYLTQLSALSSPDYFNQHGDRVNAILAQQLMKVMTLLEQTDWIAPAIDTHTGIQAHNWRVLAYHQQVIKLLAAALLKQTQGQDSQPALNQFLQLIRRSEEQYQADLDVYRYIDIATNYAGLH